MNCARCDKVATLRGFCRKHYLRVRRSGELPRVNAVNSGSCERPGCDRQAFAKRLCLKHYQQAQHPMRSTWRNLRSYSKGAYPPAWDRFEAFLADVGERPSELHQLRRPNPDLPWSRANFVWREPVTTDPEARADAKRYSWLWHIKNKYGLSEVDQMRMADEQGGKCAISGRQLDYVHPDTGREMKVCIDHCHRTGKVRGLLLDDMNKALGLIDDDPEIAQAMADYLRKHKEDAR